MNNDLITMMHCTFTAWPIFIVIPFNVNSGVFLSLFSSGGKTPDPKARTYTDVMREQSLKKQEVGEKEII